MCSFTALPRISSGGGVTGPSKDGKPGPAHPRWPTEPTVGAVRGSRGEGAGSGHCLFQSPCPAKRAKTKGVCPPWHEKSPYSKLQSKLSKTNRSLNRLIGFVQPSTAHPPLQHEGRVGVRCHQPGPGYSSGPRCDHLAKCSLGSVPCAPGSRSAIVGTPEMPGRGPLCSSGRGQSLPTE